MDFMGESCFGWFMLGLEEMNVEMQKFCGTGSDSWPKDDIISGVFQ